MRRLAITVLCLLCSRVAVYAQTFDDYINPILIKVPTAKGAKELKQLTPNLITDHDRVLPKALSTFIVVRTNEGRYAKLLVQSAKQKVNDEKFLPILFIERFVTYKEGQERTVLASGQRLSLYPGFRLSLDLGQVVPEELGGDLRFVVDQNKVYTEPVGKARLYLVTQSLPEATPTKGPKFQIGETFEPRYFNGSYKLYDDGRRSGTLKLKVEENGGVTGAYYSDRDGQKYEVKGKIGALPHSIEFSIRFPRSEQFYQGWLFTGDGKIMTGHSRLLRHEAGFYAVRLEE